MTSGGSSGPRPSIVLVVSITLTGIMANTLITAAVPDIRTHFGVGDAGAGLILASATAPGLFLAPIIGVLADRYGRREVLVPCLVAFGLAGGLGGLAPSFGLLIALRIVQGMGAAGLINLAIVIISDHWDGVERARMIGRNAAALTTSIMVLPTLGGFLTSVGGWRATFLPYWLALVTAVLVAIRLPRSTRSDATVAQQVRAAVPYLRDREVGGAIGTGFVLFVLIFGLALTTIPLYLADNFGIGPAGRGLLLAVPAVTSTIGALSVARAQERLGRRGASQVAIGLLAAGYLVVASVESIGVVVVGLLIFGLGEGLVIPALQDRVASAAPASSRGAVFAAWVAVVRAGQTAGPITAGGLIGTLGARPLFLLGAVVAMLLLLVQGWVVRSSNLPRAEQPV